MQKKDEKKYDVVTVGFMAYDMILRTVDASLFTRDTTVLDSVGFSAGGGALISAIAARVLGCRTAVIGKVSDDVFGRYCLQELVKRGVDSSWVSFCREGPISLTFAMVRPDGERNFVGLVGKNNRTLCLKDIDLSALRQTKVVGYGSFLVLPGLDKDAAVIFQTAHASGAKTVADCANNSFGQDREVVLRCLPEIDYFLPSLVEGAFLTDENNPADMAASFLARGCRNVIIKLGGEGCYVTDGKNARIVPAFPVENVCDTTGAGDNFAGGFMAAIAEGRELFEAARFANAAAAISVTGAGGVGALKDKSQVMALLNTFDN